MSDTEEGKTSPDMPPVEGVVTRVRFDVGRGDQLGISVAVEGEKEDRDLVLLMGEESKFLANGAPVTRWQLISLMATVDDIRVTANPLTERYGAVLKAEFVWPMKGVCGG